ncbi:MAG: TonB-dependent receptor [Bryobacter sp.]|jgi:outer membrane receptor protein involved in Fe transport|nr:TonB-dependent receptor [Bryobacter sp. CoA8 C33]
MTQRTILLLLIPAWELLAQANLGTILGNISDSSGAVIPAAQVTATNLATNDSRGATTNETGYYEIPLLPPGRYKLVIEAAGFKREERANITLLTGERIRISAAMQVGAAAETIEVTAGTPLVKTDTTELGVVIDNKKIVDMPLNGRNFIQLIGLQPGVIAGGGMGGRPGIQYGGLSVWSSTYNLDGTDASFIETSTPGDASGLSLVNTISVESIQEFKVSTNAFSAETGRASAAAVNIISKSGTNQYHGTLFHFFRNEKLDARNFFLTGQPRPPLRHNQFGGNASGPIRKDRIFFFGGYEAVRLRRAQVITGNVPTPLLRQTAPQVFRAALDAYPADFTPTANPNVGLHRRNSSYRDDTDTYNGRVDGLWKGHNSFFRYNYNDLDQARPQLIPTNFQIFPIRSHIATFSDTFNLTPTVVNEFRLGYNRSYINRINTTFPGGQGGLNVVGLFPADFQSRLRFANNSYTVVDNVSSVRGRHTLRAGFEIRRVQSSRIQQQNPEHNFPSLASFLANDPESVRVIYGNPGVGLRQTNYGFYLQDDLRASRNLTLNLGLRYEYYSVWNEVAGRFFNTVGDPFGAWNKPGEKIYQPDRNNFAPRVGFAYDLFGNQRTVIRSGIGLYYAPLPAAHLYSQPFISPTVPFFDVIGRGDFPGLSFPFPRTAIDNPGSSNNIQGRTIWDYNRRDEYSIQWNFSIQQAIGRDMAVQATYAGNHGINAFATRTANNFDPALNRRPVSTIGEILVNENAGRSSYNSLQLSFNKRYSKGFTFDAYYTWAKAIIYHSTDGGFPSQSILQDPDNIAGSRGLKSANPIHMFVMTGTVAIPTPDFVSASKPASLVLGGWSVQSILNIRGGLPVNIFSGRDTRGNRITNSQRPDAVPGLDWRSPNQSISNWINRNAFAFPAARQFGNLGYNTAFGPGVWNADVSVFKSFPIREKTQLQFRLEMFNAFNVARFGNPVNTLTNPLFGQITTADNPREIQLALKLYF